MTLRTSVGEEALIGGDNWQGACRKVSTSSSLLLFVLFGAKTVARYSAKTLVFYLFVRAQLLSCFLIGGIAIAGLLSFFVAFHNEWPSGDKLVIYVLNDSQGYMKREGTNEEIYLRRITSLGSLNFLNHTTYFSVQLFTY
jgi:hypothetical protein